MRLDEIWQELPAIHSRVFCSNHKYVKMNWLKECILEVGTEKERKSFEANNAERALKIVPTEVLREKWVRAFGGDSLSAARKKMKEMMLYMIFGMNVLNSGILFNNENLEKFLEASPCNKERLWAFGICFGPDGCSIQAMKARIAKVLIK